jgi:ABC-type uncharacterized transport system involved in gliding motility auxiliary subunit
MAAPVNLPPNRWLRTVNLVLQALLVATFTAGLNYVAISHPWRFDLTASHRYTLSPETLSFLAKVARPARIVVTIPEDTDKPSHAAALRDLQGLLREYVIATMANPDRRITVQYLNVAQRLKEAAELGIEEPDRVYVLSGDRRRAIPLDDLYKVKNGTRESFLGEAAITPALLEVSSPEKSHIYFLEGEGEMQLDSTDPARGLSTLRDALQALNYEVTSLDLDKAQRVPDDASLVVVAQPYAGVKPAVQEKLRQYANGGGQGQRPGSLIIVLPPAPRAHGLDLLLREDWGIDAGDDIILDATPGALTENGDLMLGFFQEHPVMQKLIDYKLKVPIGPTRSLFPEGQRTSRGDLAVSVLAYSGTEAWGERTLRPGERAVYNPGFDYKGNPGSQGRLGAIMLSERIGAAGELNFSLPRGRIIVFGGDAISNDRLVVNAPNQTLILNAINWIINRDTQLNVPARPIDRYQLTLSRAELGRLRLSLLFIAPGVAGILGLLVYWTRRN